MFLKMEQYHLKGIWNKCNICYNTNNNPSIKDKSRKKIKAITNTENAELKWKSNDESIVKIVGNSTNEITIKGVAVGKAQIQAYLEIKNKSGQIEKVKTEVCNITVVSESQTPVEEIDFSMISGEQKEQLI